MRSTKRLLVAIAALLASTTLLAVSEARAEAMSPGLFEDCSATCSGGGCEAETSWWQVWKDCICGCGPNGQPSCSCGGNAE